MDYISHYTLDAHDMPLPDDMGFFRRRFEARRLDLIADFLAALVRNGGGKRVLDAGCGTGWLSRMLARKGFAVTAADLGFDSLRRASVHGGGHARIAYANADIYRLPFGDGAFDAVVVSEVLEHVERPDAALAELGRVLTPEGAAVFAVPHRERIEHTRCIHCNGITPVNAHLHSFDAPGMEGLIRAAGLIPVRRRFFASRPAERLGLAGLTGWLPAGVWRLADMIACRIAGRESFALYGARKPTTPPERD